jgi:hypothetical protein
MLNPREWPERLESKAQGSAEDLCYTLAVVICRAGDGQDARCKVIEMSAREFFFSFPSAGDYSPH